MAISPARKIRQGHGDAVWREYCRAQGISDRREPEPEINWGLQRVYFLHVPSRREVKIGFTTNWERRKQAIGYEVGDDCVLLGFLNGGRKLETLMLQRFAAHCVRGREWFSEAIIGEARWLIQMDREFYGPEPREA
jgi:hypothetical protein